MNKLSVTIREQFDVPGRKASHQAGESFLQSILRGSSRLSAFSVVFVLFLALVHPAFGQTDNAYRAAQTFLGNQQTAVNVLDFVHFGTGYRGHEFLGAEQGVDSQGDFALVYRYYWADDGETDISFTCNPAGRVFAARVVRTNAVLAPPFVWANFSIQVVGRMVIDSDQNMSKADRDLALKLIDQADAQGLLNLWLRMQ